MRSAQRSTEPVEDVLSASHAVKIHVLVVEDDAMVATYMADVLRESGFQIAGVASTGTEALSIASTTQADLALIDIKLPGGMDGIEVARELYRLYGLRAIFLSGLNDPVTLDRAADARPLGILQKPFRPSQVYNAIEAALIVQGRSPP